MARMLTKSTTFTDSVIRLVAPRFTDLEMLGQGAFGAVYKAIDVNTGRQLALKVIKRSQMTRYLEGEIVNHSMLRHAHIVQFHEVFLTPLHVVIVMEYANGGNLLAHVNKQKRLREKDARWFFQQLIITLDYCHQRGVANRDVKLENLLLHNTPEFPLPLLKMCDFGFSKNDLMSPADSQVGTIYYMAPEIISGAMTTSSEESRVYNAKLADVWSCGVVLFTMLIGRYPFVEQGDDKLNELEKARKILLRMQTKQYRLSTRVQLSKECLHLLHSLLEPDVTRRPTLDQIKQHPWFLTDLPQDALQMTGFYLSQPPPPNFQPPAVVRQILSDAAASAGITTGLITS